MTVIAFCGPPRMGKTLLMTVFGYNNYVTKKHTCYSNYKTSFSTIKDTYDILRIPFDDVERNPKTLMFQEADKVFDARRSFRNENVLLSSLTGQSGKRNLDIYYDTQFFSRVDKSLRAVTEHIFEAHCERDNHGNPLFFEYNHLDCYYHTTHQFMIPASMMVPFFERYNSFQATEPLTESKSMTDIKVGVEKRTRKRQAL